MLISHIKLFNSYSDNQVPFLNFIFQDLKGLILIKNYSVKLDDNNEIISI